MKTEGSNLIDDDGRFVGEVIDGRDMYKIVRAVNSFDALVEALERVRDRIEPCEYVGLLDEVKAVLALAKDAKEKGKE